jgi:protein gp37
MKHSNIEWTTHTFNPWIGCTKVSPGCAHCYAETLNKRMGWTQWGDAGERFRTSAHNWNEPRRWNREAAKTGQRARVFCASLADWLDHKAPIAWRVELLALIEETPHLDWLLLTKRPESWNARMHEAMGAGSQLAHAWLNGTAPANVWIGTSIEDQQRAEERMPEIAEIPARVKFLSVEPLLGPLDLSYWLTASIVPQVQWVIVGGESGPGAREMKPEWVRALRDECALAGVAFFFKQWGGVRKKETGRTLDNETFDQLPAFAEESNT